MDFEQILEKNNYSPNSEKKNNFKIIIILVLIILYIITTAIFAFLLLNKKVEYVYEECTTEYVEEETNTLVFELSLKSGEIVYRKTVDKNSSITLTDVANNTYYLSDSNTSLFVTTTAKNEVVCIFTDKLEETTCSVKDTTPKEET